MTVTRSAGTIVTRERKSPRLRTAITSTRPSLSRRPTSSTQPTRRRGVTTRNPVEFRSQYAPTGPSASNERSSLSGMGFPPRP